MTTKTAAANSARELPPLDADFLLPLHPIELTGTFAWSQWRACGGQLPADILLPPTREELAWADTVELYQ